MQNVGLSSAFGKIVAILVSDSNAGHAFISLELLQVSKLDMHIDALNRVDGLAKSIADNGALEPVNY